MENLKNIGIFKEEKEYVITIPWHICSKCIINIAIYFYVLMIIDGGVSFITA